MDLILKLSTSKLDDEDLQTLTRQLCNSIRDETKIQAKLHSKNSLQNTKGEIVTIGTILLAFLTCGSAVALCEVLEVYLIREPSLIIEVERPEGSKVKLTAQNINPDELQAILLQVDKTGR